VILSELSDQPSKGGSRRRLMSAVIPALTVPWRKRQPAATEIASSAYTWVTCTNDGQDHAVADYLHDSGAPMPATCGHVIRPAPLCTPPGPPCRLCSASGAHRAS
jgi:hypothetical protein